VRYVKLSDLRVQLDIDDALLEDLMAEELIEIKHALDGEEVLSAADAERLRVILLLLRELEVNLPGIEVIMHMRDELLAMQQQFDEILHALVEELRKRVGGQ
jgi:MerR family transcriptional regulator/heat shock protein HspR